MLRYCLIASVLFISACSNFLFVPLKPMPLTPDAADILYEDIYLDTADGLKLHGWKLYAEPGRFDDRGAADESRGDQKTAGSILFFHGNGDNVSSQLPNTFWLTKEGYDLYVFDYREYGLSQGKAELDATINDMELMLAYVVDQLPEDEKLIIMGHSLGGAMAIHTIAHSTYRDRIKTLITIEAFSDYHDVTQDILSKSWLFWLFQWPLSYTIDNSYRPLDSIGMISPIPLLIIHSESDEMIEMYHADRLYEAAKSPKYFMLIDSNHSNIFIKSANRNVLLEYLSVLK
ncbi:MAG: alpha/beta fold hydrolase [Gammaproteobacteria bacterium]|nr:alpha/beta fold hydrolase [Gammaproteobacteria bacterium]